ncbi:MAG TPA: SLC13 family permease, partial [Acidobacteriota bacterium]|nr:SLC13 family permease [Acidobacteriota bacterium]
MTPAIAIVLVLLVLAVVLFSTERIPIDIVAIVIVVVLIVTKTLTVDDAFAGFGNTIVITIAGLFIITGGLVKTGVVDTVGRYLHQMAGNDVTRLTLWVMVLAGASAAVLKNTTTTAMLLPVVLGVADRAQIQPSKLLMPLAFGAILGGTCTLIGTSTNLAVSGLLPRYGLVPFSMFELTPVGIGLV